jgi:hypothetical protein
MLLLFMLLFFCFRFCFSGGSMNISGNNRYIIAGLIILAIVMFLPGIFDGMFLLIGRLSSLVSIAFYGLGALWFYKQLTKDDHKAE